MVEGEAGTIAEAVADAEGLDNTNTAEAEYQGVSTETMDADEAIAVAEDSVDELVEETV